MHDFAFDTLHATISLNVFPCASFSTAQCPHSRTRHETEAAEDGAPLSDADKANMFQAALQSLQIQLGEESLRMGGLFYRAIMKGTNC